MKSELLEAVKSLLKNRPRTITYADIAKKTGIPVFWLKSFAAGNIPNPGVLRIECLYRFLSKKSLSL